MKWTQVLKKVLIVTMNAHVKFESPFYSFLKVMAKVLQIGSNFKVIWQKVMASCSRSKVMAKVFVQLIRELFNSIGELSHLMKERCY